jgi:hypothetical protein
LRASTDLLRRRARDDDPARAIRRRAVEPVCVLVMLAVPTLPVRQMKVVVVVNDANPQIVVNGAYVRHVLDKPG